MVKIIIQSVLHEFYHQPTKLLHCERFLHQQREASPFRFVEHFIFRVVFSVEQHLALINQSHESALSFGLVFNKYLFYLTHDRLGIRHVIVKYNKSQTRSTAFLGRPYEGQELSTWVNPFPLLQVVDRLERGFYWVEGESIARNNNNLPALASGAILLVLLSGVSFVFLVKLTCLIAYMTLRNPIFARHAVVLPVQTQQINVAHVLSVKQNAAV